MSNTRFFSSSKINSRQKNLTLTRNCLLCKKNSTDGDNNKTFYLYSTFLNTQTLYKERKSNNENIMNKNRNNIKKR